MKIEKMSVEHIQECADLFIDVFSREPWNEQYESKEQVIRFIHNHMNNNYFVGYVLKEKDKIIALSLGMKKPWIQGMEYYIDQFCIQYDRQGEGIGSYFLKQIEERIQKDGMNAFMLQTEKGFPSEAFYKKNGFIECENMIVLVK